MKPGAGYANPQTVSSTRLCLLNSLAAPDKMAGAARAKAIDWRVPAAISF
jgi:hypothetical protein